MIHLFELGWVRLIHQLRDPVLDLFFQSLDFFDRQEFFFVLIPIVWMGIGWKPGFKLFSILFLSALMNHFLKGLFASPRPFHLDPALGIIHVHGLGFPSGAAQTVILLSGLLIKQWQNSWKWLVVIPYVLFVSFSRIYLGLHFPSDILGGWIVGLFLLFIYISIFPKIEASLRGIRPIYAFLFSQLIPLGLLFLFNAPPMVRIFSVAMGMGMGLFLSHIFRFFPEFSISFKMALLRGLMGVLMIVICYKICIWLFPAFTFLRYFLLGLWMSLGNHIFCRVLMRNEKPQNTNMRL